MTNMEEQSAAAHLVALEQSKQGTFSFLDRLANRNYATEDVEIFLDEKLGYQIQKLTLSLEGKSAEEAKAIEDRLAELKEKARSDHYIVHLQGASTESYDAIVDAANEEFPPEYAESRNPLTMAIERRVLDNESREIYFRTHLWALFIKSVEDAEGNVDTNITPEWVSQILGKAPIIAQARIHEAVQNLRMTTEWMDELQGEDFLAKS